MSIKYDHRHIETKWQTKWEEDSLYSPEITEPQIAENKFYNLWMFPYPSAEGVHVGTIFSSTGSDVFGRFMRMQGKSVFQPMGYDSFGIHSENFAIKIGEHPAKFTERAISNYERQFKAIGHGYDWGRSLATSNPDYYKWTQWLFLQMHKAGLAHKKKASVNYCPGCMTVLADEQITTPVAAGKLPPQYKTIDEVPEGVRVCERCGNIPERRELSQWFFSITKYADRLLDNLNTINWSERVTTAQREWIGRKEGINIAYPIKDTDKTVVCFTTRAETNFGATFIVVSPEYARDNLLSILPSESEHKVSKYIETSLRKTEQQRKEEGSKKTGEFTGLYASNRLNGREMPVWVSDFVLAGFGTGAVVGVPGHDRRDFEFASEFGLPIIKVVVANDGDIKDVTDVSHVHEGDGKMVNSDFINNMSTSEASTKMMDYLEEKGWGTRETTYHLRDWLISRQRYWGPPIPIIYCRKCWEAKNLKKQINDLEEGKDFVLIDGKEHMVLPVPEEDLPVKLPDIDDYKPKGDGSGPLASHPEFYETVCPECGGDARRETDVSDTFLDSSWYFLRYPSMEKNQSKAEEQSQDRNRNSDKSAWDNETTKKWLPVDLYFGGAEHAVLHLMYARFVTMALKDLGHLEFEEPFPNFYAHGLMIKDGAKMSKSRGNVVNPDEYIEKYGADTLRLYLMFMGPMDGYPDFRDTGIEGMARFTNKLWNIFSQVESVQKVPKEVEQKLHQTIQKVTEDIKIYHYNTALAAIMEYVNVLSKFKCRSREAVAPLVLLIAPFAPHIAEEAWQVLLKEKGSVHVASWPKFIEELAKSENVAIPVQVNGKHRDTIVLEANMASNEQAITSRALESQNVNKWLEGQNYKAIFVPGRLINFVTSSREK